MPSSTPFRQVGELLARHRGRRFDQQPGLLEGGLTELGEGGGQTAAALLLEEGLLAGGGQAIGADLVGDAGLEDLLGTAGADADA